MHDLRFALRSLRRTPGFLIATVLTIALGIGATTAVMTAVDRILLRPLPFPESERAVVICETSPRTADFCVASPPNVADWAAAVPALESIGVARTESALIELGSRSVGVPGGIASPGFFRALAARSESGRLFEEADLHPSRNHVLVVSHAFWRDEMGGRLEAVGSTVTLDGRPFQIIGVLAKDAYIPSFDVVQVWKPLSASVDNTDRRSWRGFLAVGRLNRGATLEDLDVQLAVAIGRLMAAYPESNAGWGVRTMRLRDHVSGSAGSTLWMFLGAVGLLLVVACANVASLLLVRAAARGPEFAVRSSLGAGRFRLIRQLLTESFVIAALGGALGLWIGALLTRLLVALAPVSIPRLEEVQMDGWTAMIALALTAATAVLFGLVPAKSVLTGSSGIVALKSGRTTNARESRAQSMLVAIELTLAVMLLVGAGVLTRAFLTLGAWNPGFDRSNVTVSWLLASPRPGTTAGTAVAQLEAAREAAAAVPGVVAAGLTSGGWPLFGGTETGAVAIQGQPAVPPEQMQTANWHDVDPNYFRSLGRRIVHGRDFSGQDVAGAAPVAIVNEAFVARMLPNANPIGQQVTVQNHRAEIVGVVADVRPNRPDRATPSEIFWPIRQYPRFGAYLVVRANPSATGVEKSIRARLDGTDRTLRVGTFSTLDSRFAGALISPRFNMLLIAMFALMAIILAAIGIYGTVAFSVSRRTREIGVRMAMGATPRSLVIEIVRRMMVLAGVGMTAGLVLSIVLGRALETVAYGVTASDPVVLTTTLAGFAVVTVTSAWLPARRASRIDPLAALRSE